MEEEEEEYCNTTLGLGLSLGDHHMSSWHQKREDKPAVHLDLSFTLCPKEESMNIIDHRRRQHRHHDKPDRTVSLKSEEEGDQEFGNKRGDHSIDNSMDGSCRKKLRLTKEQSSLLEESFKRHTTLNPVQKHSLAEQLNLKQRQVEVWFQNRRARTKLKQTEVDCEFLKKCCESLSCENRRLKKELQELKSQKIGRSSPLYVNHLGKDNTMCPSCEKTIKKN